MGEPPSRAASRAAVVEASLDHPGSDDVRFLQEAARSGPLHVRIPSDALVAESRGRAPRFPLAERVFLAESFRWVTRTSIVEQPVVNELGTLAAAHATLVVREEDADPSLGDAARARDVRFRAVSRSERAGFPIPEATPPPASVPRVIVTGCYDWLHSGHVRFFLDASALGALYVVIGSDRNVALLKGPGHPLQGEQERRYMVGSVRCVTACLVSSGSGWMDAEPEMAEIGPRFYVVNEDGDQPEKREFCRAHGIEYVVLQRVPHAGLPARTSTELRGF